MEDKYIISKDELLKLLERDAILSCLERDGVDNWTWYMEGKSDFMEECFGVNAPDMDFIDIAYVELEKYDKYKG